MASYPGCVPHLYDPVLLTPDVPYLPGCVPYLYDRVDRCQHCPVGMRYASEHVKHDFQQLQQQMGLILTAASEEWRGQKNS